MHCGTTFALAARNVYPHKHLACKRIGKSV